MTFICLKTQDLLAQLEWAHFTAEYFVSLPSHLWVSYFTMLSNGCLGNTEAQLETLHISVFPF